MQPGSGPLALVGSGEYLAVMAGVEGALIEGRPRRYVQIPTAAAPEGPDRLRYWLDLGAAQAERLGVEQVPVVVRDRGEAGSEDLAALTGGGRSWQVHGRQQAWILAGGQDQGTDQSYPAGANIKFDLYKSILIFSEA